MFISYARKPDFYWIQPYILYFFKKAPKLYGFQEASEKPKCHFCTPCKARPRHTHRCQAFPGCSTLRQRGPSGGAQEDHTPTRAARPWTRLQGWDRALRRLSPAGPPAAWSTDTRSPRTPGHRPRPECQAGGRPRGSGTLDTAPRAGVAGNPAGLCPPAQALVQHFGLGGLPHPVFPHDAGRPRAGSPRQQRPQHPLEKTAFGSRETSWTL